ncbi:MAG: hypothetical protein JO175_04640, partial [Candidatus Eremiobacteraeota bacterium]|nr:hypothetical protein [Candidatus Eremiobacteraeota bacterium]
TPITLGTGLNLPFGIAVDSNGNLFVADSANNRIAELVAVNGSVPPGSSFVGVGSGWNQPYGVGVDKNNDIYVANNAGASSSIKEMIAINGILPPSPSTVTLGGGWAGPWDVTVDNSGNIFVADYTAGIKEMPPGCSSASCVTQISTVPYTTALTVH